MLEEFIARMFALRNAVHLAHWAVRGPGSYAMHGALGDLYEAIPGKLDMFVEVYQGEYDLIGTVETYDFDKANIVEQIRAASIWLRENRSGVAKGSPTLENLVDDIGAMFDSALYKLRFLA